MGIIMSNWNHRVVKIEQTNGEIYYGIHEVYYDDDNKVNSWTENPVRVQEESIEELRITLERMLKSLDKDIIDEKEMLEKIKSLEDE